MIRTFTAQGVAVQLDTSNEGVFHPHPITLLLANALKIQPGDRVLEIGTGSGFLAILAAKLGAAEVIASDIASAAVAVARANASRNGVDSRLSVVQGDMFVPFPGEAFDVIVSNPPCMPFPAQATFENAGLRLAMDSGEDGADLVVRLIAEAVGHLTPAGHLLVPVPKWSNWRRILAALGTSCEYEVASTGLVQYYLDQHSSAFRHHIRTLHDSGMADIEFLSGLPYAEVLVCRGQMESNGMPKRT